jgi:aryl carrier-like protein
MRAGSLDSLRMWPMRLRWRKLHLAVDADTQEIAAVDLTPDEVGDISALPDL